MRYLLDSNVIIAAMLGLDGALRQRLAKCDEGDLVTSTVAYAEMLYGSNQGKPPRSDALDRFMERVPALPFDHAAARAYASLPFKRASFDQLIGAHALSLGLTLVTFNMRHFIPVPNLRIEAWAK